MSREKAGFRDTMEALGAAFPGKGALNRTEAARFLGVSPRTVQRWIDTGRLRWPEKMPVISCADLARQVCG